MPNVSLSKPSRGKGKKSAVYTMYWRVDGKLFKKSTGTRDKDAAKLIAREFERKLALGPHGLVDPFAPYAGMSWADARARFAEHCGNKHARHPDTIDAYEYSLLAFEKIAKPRLLREITTRTLTDFTSKRVAKVTAATTNKDLRHVRAMLRWCHEQHYLRVLPDFRAASVREDRKLPVVVSQADFDKLLAAIPKAKLYHCTADWLSMFVRIAHALGPRRGEILKLRWSQIDFRSLTLSISSTTSKGRGDRAVPLDLSLAALLAFWWLAAGEPGGKQLVLPLAAEKLRRIYDDWDRVCKVAGVVCRFKDFRSTCGSELLNSGTPSVIVRDVLGHSSVLTTERFYLAPSQEAMRAAMERRNG